MTKSKKKASKSTEKVMSPADCEKQRLEFQEILGVDILKRRVDKGLLQKQVINASGITQSSMSDIESGLTNLTLGTMMQLARGHKTSISAIFRHKIFHIKL